MANEQDRIAAMLAAGVPEDRAREFLGTGLRPSEVARYVSSGLGLGDIHDVRELGLPIEEYGSWIRIVGERRFIAQVLQLGLTQEEANALCAGVQTPAIAGILTFLGEGHTVDDVLTLKCRGVYFGRYSLGPKFNLAEQILQEQFGSIDRWRAWQCLGKSVREALALDAVGTTPLQVAAPDECRTSTTLAKYVSELKEFRFPGVVPPEIFEPMRIRKWTEPILRGIGFTVSRTSIRSEFLDDHDWDVCIRINENTKAFCTATLSESGSEWQADHVNRDGTLRRQEKVASLDTALLKIAELTSGRGKLEIEVRSGPRNLALQERLFISLGALMSSDTGWKNVSYRSRPLAVHISTTGVPVAIPEHEVARAVPGRDEIVQFGSIGVRYVGMHAEPCVVLDAKDRDDVLAKSAEWRQALPPEVESPFVVIRHHVDAVLVDGEPEVFDCSETSIAPAGITYRDLQDRPQLFEVRENEVLEILFDSGRFRAEEICLLLHLAAEGEWNDESRFLELLDDLSLEDAPYIYSVPDCLSTRLVLMNGEPWMPLFRDAPVFTPVVADGEVRPELSTVFGWHSFIETESRVSGTYSEELGCLADGTLVEYSEPDDFPFEINRIADPVPGYTTEHAVHWLLQSEYAHSSKAWMFIEQAIGFLRGGSETTMAHLSDGESETLEMHLSFDPPEGVSHEAIVDALAAADAFCAQLVHAIRNPDSPEGVARISRLRALGVDI